MLRREKLTCMKRETSLTNESLFFSHLGWLKLHCLAWDRLLLHFMKPLFRKRNELRKTKRETFQRTKAQELDRMRVQDSTSSLRFPYSLLKRKRKMKPSFQMKESFQQILSRLVISTCKSCLLISRASRFLSFCSSRLKTGGQVKLSPWDDITFHFSSSVGRWKFWSFLPSFRLVNGNGYTLAWQLSRLVSQSLSILPSCSLFTMKGDMKSFSRRQKKLIRSEKRELPWHLKTLLCHDCEKWC